MNRSRVEVDHVQRAKGGRCCQRGPVFFPQGILWGWGLLIVCACIGTTVEAATYTDDFSGDLSAWTPSPTNLDGYGIVNGALWLDGKGHLSGSSGWGVMRFEQPLGNRFTAAWDVKITSYDYVGFTLFADAPWSFQADKGEPVDGYSVWADINDPVLPLLDAMRRDDGVIVDLPTPQRNIPVSPDLPRDQWFRMAVRMDRGTLQVWIDGTKYIDTFDPTYADANFKIGVTLPEDTVGFIDNFEVTVVPEPGGLSWWLVAVVAGVWRILPRVTRARV